MFPLPKFLSTTSGGISPAGVSSLTGSAQLFAALPPLFLISLAVID